MAPGAAAVTSPISVHRHGPPEHEHNYSFHVLAQDLQLWLMLTELQPAQQAAAIVVRLGGVARELVRVNGAQVDPITYIVTGLQQRFAMLDDEPLLAAMTQLLACFRRQGEIIKSRLRTFCHELGGVRPPTPPGTQRIITADDTAFLQHFHSFIYEGFC